LNGFVKNEYVKEITSKKETLKLLILNKLFKSYFFIALILISALCFGILYLLKNKLVQLDIIGNFSLVIKSFLIGFIFTIIGTLYYFYDLFSFFKIVGVGILLIILYYRISSIFKIEKQIKDDKLFLNKNSKENLKNISKEIVREQITNENNKLTETESNLDIAINKTNEIKRQQFNLIKELVDYTTPKYDSSIRQNALELLLRFNFKDEIYLQSLVNATTHHKWQFVKFGKETIRKLLKNEEFRKLFNNLAPKLSDTEKASLERLLSQK
jgi:hypothetical protein